MNSTFQQQQNAIKHYQRILTAKPTLPEKQRKRSLHLRPDPIKDYEFRKNNQRLAIKLLEIYGDEPKKRKRRHKKKGKSLINEYKKKQHEITIDHNNLKMIQRIEAAKSTIGNFQKRKKNLNTYRKLSKKSMEYSSRDDSLFKEFRKTLLEPGKKGSMIKRQSINF